MEPITPDFKEAVIARIEFSRKELYTTLREKKRLFIKGTWFPLILLKEIAQIKGQIEALDEIETEFYDGNLGQQ